MKHWLLLISALLLTLQAVALDYDFEIEYNGARYCFKLDGTNTNSVTMVRPDSVPAYVGDVIIPPSFAIDGNTYYVTSIAYDALDGCDGLTSLSLPQNIRLDGALPLRGCSRLTAINVATDNKYYSSIDGILFNKTNTKLIRFPPGKNTDSYAIPETVTEISYCAFNDCDNLKSLKIPESVTNIVCDFDCENLTAINVAPLNPRYSSRDGVLFEGWERVLMRYPRGKNTDSYAIPETVTEISPYAFYGCEALKSVSVPPSVTDVGPNAFEGTAWYNSQPDGVVYAGNVLYKYKGDMPEDTTLVIKIKKGCVSVSYFAFESCVNLKSLEIPKSVTHLGYSNLVDSENLTAINVDPENPKYSSIDGVLFAKWGKGMALERYPRGKNSETYEIPTSVKYISGFAFNGCEALKSVSVPKNVTDVGPNAFEGTAWYNSQPDGVVYAGNVLYKYKGDMPEGTSLVIKKGCVSVSCSAFANNKKLESIVTPKSVKVIGMGAFQGCERLTTVEMKGVSIIEDWAFAGCEKLTSVKVPKNVTDVAYDAFDGTAWYNSQPNGVVYAGNVLYKYKGDMPEGTSLVIKKGCTVITDYAFRHCEGLNSVTIPQSVTRIGSHTFDGCLNMRTIICHAVKPPKILYFPSLSTTPLLYGVAMDVCVLYVPKKSLAAYKTAPGWGKFKQIRAID